MYFRNLFGSRVLAPDSCHHPIKLERLDAVVSRNTYEMLSHNWRREGYQDEHSGEGFPCPSYSGWLPRVQFQQVCYGATAVWHRNAGSESRKFELRNRANGHQSPAVSDRDQCRQFVGDGFTSWN